MSCYETDSLTSVLIALMTLFRLSYTSSNSKQLELESTDTAEVTATITAGTAAFTFTVKQIGNNVIELFKGVIYECSLYGVCPWQAFPA